jgi:DNA-binding GntR family transcriptional regulator
MTLPAPLEPVERKATAGVIADLIRQRIVDGSFPPGTQLGEVSLAEQLGVSRGPVREALQRLIQEGLLDGRPHRGVFVAELQRDDVIDVYRARRAIERAAAELVIARRDAIPLDGLRRLVERMDAAARRGRWSNVVDLDRRFHQELVEASGSKRLGRMFGTLVAETALCMAALESAYPMRDGIVDEHRKLLDSLEAGDRPAVLACIDEHLDQAVRHLTSESLGGRTES